MKRSKLQSKEILDWYKKRSPQKVKRNSIYLPQELEQQEQAQVIFQNLDKEGQNKLPIESLYHLCVQSGMKLNKNQVKMLFEPFDQNKSKNIDLDEFEKSILDVNKREQFTVVAKKIKETSTHDGYIPIYYGNLLSHLSFVSKREEIRQKIQMQSDSISKFKGIKDMMKLEYQKESRNSENGKEKTIKRQLSELKQDYEGPKIDGELAEFVTQMNSQIQPRKLKRQSLSQKHSLSLPKINTSMHNHDQTNQNTSIQNSRWYKKLNEIDSVVREQIYQDRSNKSTIIQALKNQAQLHMKKAKKMYNVQFDYVSEKQHSITDEKYTGGRSFEEGLLSILQQQQPQQFQQQSISNCTHLSTIKREEQESGDHLPKTLLRKLKKFQQITKDSSQIILDKSLLSSQSKQSRIITPYYYHLYQHTNTDSQMSNQESTTQKKRTLSQQELKYITPHFKGTDIQLPPILNN